MSVYSILYIALVGISLGQRTLVSLGLVGEAFMVGEHVHIYDMESSFFENFWSSSLRSTKYIVPLSC